MIARLREVLDVARAMLRRPVSVTAPMPVRTFDEMVEAQRMSPGLAPCPTCATPQQPRDGHMAVHFASATAQRPCVGSWPARKAAA